MGSIICRFFKIYPLREKKNQLLEPLLPEGGDMEEAIEAEINFFEASYADKCDKFVGSSD